MKLLHDSRESTIQQGLAQTAEYLQRAGGDEGHLVLFERRREIPWSGKIFREEHPCQDFTIQVWGM